jgi:hypothetical protein
MGLSVDDSSNLAFPNPKITIGNLTLVLVAYFAFNFIWQIVHYRFFHPLSKFPGPFWGSVTRLWIAWHNVRSTELTALKDLSDKYGTAMLRMDKCVMIYTN